MIICIIDQSMMIIIIIVILITKNKLNKHLLLKRLRLIVNGVYVRVCIYMSFFVRLTPLTSSFIIDDPLHSNV